MKRVAIIIAEGFEEIECITTADILRRGGVEVELLGLNDINITGAHSITITCDEVFDYHSLSNFDGLVLVGGMKNAITLSENVEVLKVIENYYDSGRLIAGICATPSIVFSKTTILLGKNATCYPSQDLMSNISRFVDMPVVVSGNVITSQSPATTMDFALAILSYFDCDINGLVCELRGK